jgi:hypothetical protein
MRSHSCRPWQGRSISALKLGAGAGVCAETRIGAATAAASVVETNTRSVTLGASFHCCSFFQHPSAVGHPLRGRVQKRKTQMVSSKAKMVSIVFRAELVARSAKTRPRPSGPEDQRAGSREPLRRAPSKFYVGLRGENSRRGQGFLTELPRSPPPPRRLLLVPPAQCALDQRPPQGGSRGQGETAAVLQ